jgi:hypothetical protein
MEWASALAGEEASPRLIFQTWLRPLWSRGPPENL